MALTHYIVVRRDMPFGAIAAQIAHAAGESFYHFAMFPSSSRVAERAALKSVRADAGSTPASGANLKCGAVFENFTRIDGERVLASRVECDREPHVGNHRGYDQERDVPLFWADAITYARSGAQIDETRAVILGARNEGRLQKLVRSLVRANIEHCAIVETDGEFATQWTAVGIFPCEKEKVEQLLKDFHMFPDRDRELLAFLARIEEQASLAPAAAEAQGSSDLSTWGCFRYAEAQRQMVKEIKEILRG